MGRPGKVAARHRGGARDSIPILPIAAGARLAVDTANDGEQAIRILVA
jgi:hypothetical protein